MGNKNTIRKDRLSAIPMKGAHEINFGPVSVSFPYYNQWEAEELDIHVGQVEAKLMKNGMTIYEVPTKPSVIPA